MPNWAMPRSVKVLMLGRDIIGLGREEEDMRHYSSMHMVGTVEERNQRVFESKTDNNFRLKFRCMPFWLFGAKCAM